MGVDHVAAVGDPLIEESVTEAPAGIGAQYVDPAATCGVEEGV
jgi:hypothetical protein